MSDSSLAAALDTEREECGGCGCRFVPVVLSNGWPVCPLCGWCVEMDGLS